MQCNLRSVRRLGGVGVAAIMAALGFNAQAWAADPTLSFTRAFSTCSGDLTGGNYVPGQLLTITLTIESTPGDPLTALGLTETIPAGWSFHSLAVPNDPPISPTAGATGDLSFAYIFAPAMPASFTYLLTPPASAGSGESITGTIEYRTTGDALFSTPAVDNLTANVSCPTLQPCIQINGSATVTADCKSIFTDPGATTGCNPMPVGWTLVTEGTVDTAVLGAQTIRYVLKDDEGAEVDSASRTVTVVDNAIPTITLIGGSSVIVECGAPAYTDAGATAFDECEGDISSSIQITNNVDTKTEGAYQVSINVSDESGNGATTTVRTVVVQDNTGPVVSLIGAASMTVDCGSVFVDPGATATDACEGFLGTVPAQGSVNTAVPGNYTLAYILSDGSGNQSQPVTRQVTVFDLSKPVLQTPSTSVTIECAGAFTENVTATDNCDGDVTALITKTGTVDRFKPGTYQRTYSVRDLNFNTADPLVVTYTVLDRVPPTLTLTGPTSITLQLLQPYVEPGFTATDTCGGNLTSRVLVAGTVDTRRPGTYNIFYTVSDTFNPVVLKQRTVTVLQGNPPTLTLNGSASITLECGANFTDPGATASDAVGGDITSSIVVTGSVDNREPGNYTLTYNVQNEFGQAATPLTRTVIVADTKAPSITLTGAAAITIECGTAYADAGATASDECDGNITGRITATGVAAVNTGVPGAYTITYTVTDGAGRSAAKLRTVTVVDTTVPVVTLNGNAEVRVECGSAFSDPGASAADVCAGNLDDEIVVSGTFDTNTPGIYTLTYAAQDPSANTGTAVRTVRVADTTLPTVSLIGADPLLVPCGVPLADPGINATDSCDVDVLVSSNGDTAVDTNKAGIYTMIYTAADLSGNTRQVSRRVIVDLCPAEGEGEGEGEGEIPCGDNPVGRFDFVTPTDGLSFRIPDYNGTIDIPLSVHFEFASGCPAVGVVVNYRINDTPVGTTPDISHDFPISASLGIGEYFALATASVGGTGYTVVAATTFRIERGIDVDNNGFLDDPFSLAANAAWSAAVSIGGEGRAVGMIRWSGGEGKDLDDAVVAEVVNPARPEQHLRAVAPRALLQAGEDGVLIVTLANTLDALFTPEDSSDLADSLPDGFIPGGAFFDVSIIVSGDGGASYDKIAPARVDAQPVTISLSGLNLTGGSTAFFFEHPTDIAQTESGFTVVPDDGAWTDQSLHALEYTDGTLSAEASALSAFAPVERQVLPPQLSITPGGNAFDFGNVAVNGTATQDFTLRNTGDGVVAGTVTVYNAFNAFGLGGTTTYELHPGDVAIITVTFHPQQAQNYLGSLSFENGSLGTRTFLVSGIGTKANAVLGCGPANGAGGSPAGDLAVIWLAFAALAAAWRVSRASAANAG